MPTAEAVLSSPEVPANDRVVAAHKIIRSSCNWAAASGAVPIPLLDVAAMGAVQATMLNRIAKLYGHAITDETARSMIAVVLGSILPAGVAGVAVGSGVKFVPGFGWLLGSAAMGTLGYGATYAIGKVFVRHFEAGGTAESFDATAIDKTQAAEDMKNAKRATEK